MGSSDLNIKVIEMIWYELNTYIIMAIIAILAIADEKAVFGLKQRHGELIHPGHLNDFTGKSNLPTQISIEIGGSVLKYSFKIGKRFDKIYHTNNEFPRRRNSSLSAWLSCRVECSSRRSELDSGIRVTRARVLFISDWKSIHKAFSSSVLPGSFRGKMHNNHLGAKKDSWIHLIKLEFFIKFLPVWMTFSS